MNQSFGTNDAVSIAIEKHADMVRRISFLYVRNEADVEDVFQDVFLTFFQNAENLQSEEHQQAWLARVTFNKCKDLVKSYWRKKVVSIEEMEIPYETPHQGELLQAILALPTDCKDLIYLHYYEGRTIPQIAEMLHQNLNTVYSRLKRAKRLLQQKVGDIE